MNKITEQYIEHGRLIITFFEQHIKNLNSYGINPIHCNYKNVPYRLEERPFTREDTGNAQQFLVLYRYDVIALECPVWEMQSQYDSIKITIRKLIEQDKINAEESKVFRLTRNRENFVQQLKKDLEDYE